MTTVTTAEKIRAIKEAAADTLLGSIINVPLNFIMVSIAFYYELTAVETTAFMTTVFTILAIIRKTYIRLHFHKRYQKNLQDNASNA